MLSLRWSSVSRTLSLSLSLSLSLTHTHTISLPQQPSARRRSPASSSTPFPAGSKKESECVCVRAKKTDRERERQKRRESFDPVSCGGGNKKTPNPLGPPCFPRHRPTIGSPACASTPSPAAAQGHEPELNVEPPSF